MKRTAPIVGSWYQVLDLGTIFEVVAYDEEDECVEVQHLDGEVAEYDLDTWRDMHPKLVAPPEDWRSGFELSREDAVDPEQPLQTADWTESVDQIEDVSDDDWEE